MEKWYLFWTIDLKFYTVSLFISVFKSKYTDIILQKKITGCTKFSALYSHVRKRTRLYLPPLTTLITHTLPAEQFNFFLPILYIARYSTTLAAKQFFFLLIRTIVVIVHNLLQLLSVRNIYIWCIRGVSTVIVWCHNGGKMLEM